MNTVGVLLNPHAAGGKAARLAPALRDWCNGQSSPAELRVADSVADALAWLRSRPQGSTVALVGGDGTVNQMLPALLERHLCLALVPQGSGNDLARALGVAGMPWRAALDRAQHAPPRAIDVGWLQADGRQRPFLSSLTVGFDSAVGLRALNGPRWLRGLPRYLLATLRELVALQNWDMQVLLDGAPVHSGATLFASTLNTPSYGSGMPAVPHAQIDDGRLDLLLAGAFNRPQTLGMLPRLLMARHLGHPRVQCRPFSRLQIRSHQALPLAADGEYAGEASDLEVRVAPAALQVLRGP